MLFLRVRVSFFIAFVFYAFTVLCHLHKNLVKQIIHDGRIQRDYPTRMGAGFARNLERQPVCVRGLRCQLGAGRPVRLECSSRRTTATPKSHLTRFCAAVGATEPRRMRMDHDKALLPLGLRRLGERGRE